VRFADTSFWFALQDRDDRRHQEARALARSARRSRLLVSNHVVGETWTLVRRRMSHSVALEFIDLVHRLANVEVVHVDPATEREAWDWLRHHDERKYSFVDATSFALMRARGVREALAFDGDFSAAGFVEVRPRV
jgi:predicted nucleic acid-binding protein